MGGAVISAAAPGSAPAGLPANSAARGVAPHRRTLAFGIVSAAGSIGTMLPAPIAASFVNHGDWRAGLWAFLILALAMLPAAFVGSRADHLPNSRVTDRNLTLGGALDEAGRRTR